MSENYELAQGLMSMMDNDYETMSRVSQEMDNHELSGGDSSRGRPQMYCDCSYFLYDENDGEEFTNKQVKEGLFEYNKHLLEAIARVLSDS